MHRRLHAVALAALLLSAVPASRAQTIVEQGLLAYYPLEFNARDSGTGHYDGTIAGGPLESDPDGVHGRSLALDGVDDAISFASSRIWKSRSSRANRTCSCRRPRR